MVSYNKLIGGLMAVTCFLTTSLAATSRKSTKGERVAALYVKDDSNGELRFLGNSGNTNAQINQLITEKQDMLEQLRPTGTSNWGTAIGTGTFTGTGTGSLTGTPSGQIISGLGGSGVTPIVINTGGNGGSGGSSSNSGSVGGAITGASPIADLLPQIIAQAVAGGTRAGGSGQRRRVINNRHVVNNRRRRRPTNNDRPQIFVVRPRN